jgi:beta-phosphoglucomutase-like phosphatase (HAD superfamily)
MIAVLFDLEGTLVQSVETDQNAILEFRTRTKEKLLELGIAASELDGIVAFALMYNKAIEYVQKHFTENEARSFNREIDKYLKGCQLPGLTAQKSFQIHLRHFKS